MWCTDHTIWSLWLVIFRNHLRTYKRWDVFISILQIKKLWISKFRMCQSQMTRKQRLWDFNHACRTFKVHAISGLFLGSFPPHHLLFKLFLVWLVGFCCYCCLFVVVLLIWFSFILFRDRIWLRNISWYWTCNCPSPTCIGGIIGVFQSPQLWSLPYLREIQ